jgi:hypothetical protein
MKKNKFIFSWKNLPFYLKTGLITSLIYIAIAILERISITLMLNDILSSPASYIVYLASAMEFPFKILNAIFGESLYFTKLSITGHIITILSWFLIGTLIGMIIDKSYYKRK